MGVNPRGADLRRFLEQGTDGEVVMVNLLRFAKGGREQYEAYAYAIEVMASASQTPDAREGVDAFLSKRPASWPD